MANLPEGVGALASAGSSARSSMHRGFRSGKAYDADRIREMIEGQGATPCFSKRLYRERSLIERFFSKLKRFRRVATCYDKLAANFLAMVQLAPIRPWLRAYESTPQHRPADVRLATKHFCKRQGPIMFSRIALGHQAARPFPASAPEGCAIFGAAIPKHS